MPTYNGNVVPYGSGGHWYVQLIVVDDGIKTATTSAIRISYRIVFENSIVDSNNSISGSDGAGGWSSNNFAFNGAGNYLIAQRDYEAPIQYGGGTTQHIVFTATGMAGGGTGPSTVIIDYPMPPRAASPPDPPAITVDTVGATSAHVWCIAAGAENGATTTIVNYRIHRVSDGAWMGDLTGGYSGVTYTNLAPGELYDAYAQSGNIAGYGGFSAPVRFRTLTGLRIFDGSTWVNAPVYVFNGTSWVVCEVRVFNGTSWVAAG